MSKNVKKNHYRFAPIAFMLLFPLITFYFECVFRISTVGGIFNFSTICMLLFSFSYGLIIYIVSTLFKKKKITYIITSVLLALNGLIYAIEYFVYRQFKVFYDVNTVVMGASDAVGGFGSDIARLIFCFDGIFKIILFFAPAVLFIIFGKRLFPTMRSNAARRIITAITSVLCYVLSLVLVLTNTVLSSVYKKEYNYQTAVSKFGLYTGIRLDIKNILFGGRGGSFEVINPVDNPEQEPQEIVYDLNKMELDLTGGSGRIKELNTYVSGLSATHQNEYTGLFKGKNLIFITAEAFTDEVIDETLTPTLYRLANKGIQFTDYYQPASAGTTGGEYQNIFGMIPLAGGASFKNTSKTLNYFTLGSQLDRLGYYGKAYHNNSHTYYSRHITHNNLGYSDGFMGYGNGMEEYVKAVWPQSDLEMIAGTLPTYIDKQPFNIYYMSVSGHSGYSTTGNSMTAKNWEKVKDLPYTDRVKGYFAANLELENAMAHLVSELEAKGIADDTVIVISTDHFPYGLDDDAKLGNMPYLSELYGYQVNNLFERDHSRLIVWSGCLEDKEPIVVDSPTFSLDILPTLSNLFGTEFDSRLFVGRDVFSEADALVFNTNYDWKTDLGTYYAGSGKFVPKDANTEIPEDYVENIKSVVRNKMRYCEIAPANDYFRYLFG